MGNTTTSDDPNSIISNNQEDFKIEANLSEYRWYCSHKVYSWANITGKEKWIVFPIELAEKVEQAYVNRVPYQYGEKIVLFKHDDSRHVQIKVKNAWKQKLVLRELPSNITIMRKNTLNRFNPIPLSSDNYLTNLSNKFKIITNEEIFYQFDIQIKEKNIIRKFLDYYLIVSNRLHLFLNEDYQLYIKNNYSKFINKKLTVELIKNLLIFDFTPKRSVFLKYYINNLTEDNFCKTIVQMFLEESFLYLDLVTFTATCNSSNIELTTYYLCLLFSLSELNKTNQNIRKYSTYYYSENVYVPKKYYYSSDLILTSKTKFNINGPFKDNKEIEIIVNKPPMNNICFNISPFDMTKYSIYNNSEVVFPNNSVFYCRKVTETKVQFEVVQDYITSMIPIMSTQEKNNYGLFEDITNIYDTDYLHVIFAKLKARQLKNTSKIKNVRSIDIFGNDIKAEGMILLSSNFLYFPNLLSLSIIGSNVGVEGFKIFNDNIKNIPLLRYLNLSYNIIKDSEIEQIKFNSIPHLESLILRENQITSKGMLHLCDELSSFCPSLRILDLYDNLIEDDGITFLSRKIERLKSIELLDFWNCGITDKGVNVFCDIIIEGNLSELDSLNFKNNQIGEESLQNLLKALPYLKNLNYCNFSQTKFTETDFDEILKCLLSNNKNWKFNMNSGEFCLLKEDTDETTLIENEPKNEVKEIIPQNPFIRKNIRKKSRKKSCMIPEMKFSCQNLNSLTTNPENYINVKCFNFSESNIKDEGFKQFLSITFQLPSIEKIILSFNELTPVSMEYFTSFSFYLKHIKSIDLSSNNIGDTGMKSFAEGISKCPSIETITLCWNKIGDKGLKMMIAKFDSIPNIKTFDLYGNLITDEGFTAFAKIPYYNIKKLQNLNFGKNQIGNNGMKAFSDSFENFSALTDLNLSGNKFNDEGIRAFTINIQLVLNLLSLDISDNPISDNMKEYLLQQGFPSTFILE